MTFTAPEPLKEGPKWTQAEIDIFRAWCFQESQRKYILLSVLRTLSRRGYVVSKDDIEGFWSTFTSTLKLRLQGYIPRKGRCALQYLIKGCAQFVIDRRRVIRRRGEIMQSLSDQSRHMRLNSMPSDNAEMRIVESIDAEKNAQRIRFAIEKLPKEEGALIRQRYFEERTIKDIALAQDLPVSTIKMRLLRARSHLRKILLPVQETRRAK